MAVLRKKISPRFLAVAAVALLAIMLVPLVRGAFFTRPWADDYTYGAPVRHWLMGEPYYTSLWDALKKGTIGMYYAYQGPFVSAFFMAFSGLAGERYYFILSLILIFVLTGTLFGVCYIWVRRLLHAERCESVFFAACTTIAVIELVYSASNAFYWWVGAVHYILMHSFMLWMITLAMCGMTSNRRLTQVLTAIGIAILGFNIGGGNYVTALQSILLLLLFAGIGILGRNKRAIIVLPGILTFALAFYYNVNSPGNQVRGSEYSSMGVLEAIWGSFEATITKMPRMFDVMFIVVLLVLLPVAWNMTKRVSFSFKLPLLVTILSYCFYATGYTPFLFATGGIGVARVFNVVKIDFQLLFIFNLFYWSGWVNHRFAEGKGIAHTWSYYMALCVAAVCIFVWSPNQAGSYSSYGAYYYIHSGELGNMYNQYKERLEILESDQKDIVFEPYRYKPWLFYIEDMSSDPGYWINTAVCSWYGKNTIIVQ